MKKKIITTLSVVLTVMLSLSVFTACSKNKHKYSTDWKYDETSHWHECTTKKHKDTRDFAAHDFGAGVVTAQPTEEAEGLKTLTCGTCGYQKTEKVPKLAHTHKLTPTYGKRTRITIGTPPPANIPPRKARLKSTFGTTER